MHLTSKKGGKTDGAKESYRSTPNLNMFTFTFAGQDMFKDRSRSAGRLKCSVLYNGGITDMITNIGLRSEHREQGPEKFTAL